MNSLKLRISQADHSYAVELLRLANDNTWQEVTGEISPAFDSAEVSQFVLNQRGPSPKLRSHGETLGAFLLRDKVWSAWQDEGKPTRTYLDIAAADLAMLPWEIAYREAHLFLNPERTLLRAHNLKISGTIDEIWPVRLLVVIGSTDGAIAADEEAKAIRLALRPKDRTFYFKELCRPTRPELGACLTEFRPHILHFIGHGDERNGRARLRFVDARNQAWFWTPDEIRADLLLAGQVPRFAYLNACRTYAAGQAQSTQGQPQGHTLSKLFLNAGAGAVLAMQADVVGKTAGLCAARLYQEVASGTALDQALARAQIVVSQNVQGFADTREPFMGALTVSWPPEEVLTVRSSKQETVKAIEQCTMLSNVIKVFVDRTEQRAKVIDSFYPADPKGHRHSLVLVQGDSQVGKSWIAQRLRTPPASGPLCRGGAGVLRLARRAAHNSRRRRTQTKIAHSQSPRWASLSLFRLGAQSATGARRRQHGSRAGTGGRRRRHGAVGRSAV
jgi:hypothetical protein